ncbi:MAG TPA: peptidoglycan-binding domain-containing protein [Candidatus Angelobacter sp.]|jgi:multidrug efflux pump subunit AcrA (membrane-fusion protein)|nr:peptidoglycan-binding domain-containing protein [Candidatus Angelobacter sp.]
MTGISTKGVAVALGLAALAAAFWVQPWHTTGAAALPSSTAPLGTAQIRRMDLAATAVLQGLLGYASPSTVATQIPATSSQATPLQAEAAVRGANQQLAAARAALADTQSIDQVTATQAGAALARTQQQRTTDQQTLDADQARLTTDTAQQQHDCGQSPPAAACSADQQAVQHDQQAVAADQQAVAHDTEAITSAQEAVDAGGPHARQAEDAQASALAAAEIALASAQAQLDALRAGTVDVVTALPDAGQVIDRGQSLYSLGGRPVPLLFGTVPAYRALGPGSPDGPDITQLEDNLNQLGAGQGLPLDGHWSAALTAAVGRWQAALGVPPAGAVGTGEIVFLPAAVRVASPRIAVGAAAPPGTAVLDVTGTARVVTASLPVLQAPAVHTGDAVSVALPDGHSTVAGHVASVASSVASPTGGQAGQQQTQGNGAPQAQVTVTVSIDDPSKAAAFDAAPVSVSVVTRSVHGVLAVPVNALVALAEGGYAVEVVASGGAHRLVAVTPGLFDQAAMVEVQGAGLHEGMTVVVPAQ